MPVVIRNPYAETGEYRKAQLHCHTTASDGRFRPDELLRMYKDAGYAFVCITDHNRVTRDEALNDEHFLALPGTEDTVPRILHPLGSHMGRVLVDESLRGGSSQERIDRTLARGGIVSLCHPSWPGNLWTGSWSARRMQELRGFHLVEIWNPHSKSTEDVRRWTSALRTHGPGSSIWGVAVDDCHHQRQFNKGWIMVKVPKISAAAFKRALVAGAFYASTGPMAEFGVVEDRIEVRLTESSLIRFIDWEGRPRAEVTGLTAHCPVRGDEGYLRVECAARSGSAWGQPFWILPD